jgi:hypothetical protein
MIVFTLIAGGEKVDRGKTVCMPEGLLKRTWIRKTPERSSVAETFTVTLAGPADVLMVVGVKLNAVRVGGVTSWIWAEECERATQKKVTANMSPTFDERSTRHRDWSCMEARNMGFSLGGKVEEQTPGSRGCGITC